MFRLLALLQLTRAALAFTAIADAWTVLLLSPENEPDHPMGLMIIKMILTGIVSCGLYGFGMALNDLLDSRHDRIFAKWRPIPSGRINPRTAIIVAFLLLLMSLFAAAMLTPLSHEFIPWSLLFTFATALLIVFYDATSKYLGAVGVLTLAAIRGVHCLIGHPQTPLLFLSMFLLNHIFIVSLLAYPLENKRPHLRIWDVTLGTFGVLMGNLLALIYMWLRGTFQMPVWKMLLGPSIAAAIFILWALWLLTRKTLSPRQRGERLMLMGLFWLFVYDASMLLSNGQYLATVAIILLLICAVASFFGIRYINQTIVAGKVQYRRGE